MTRDLNPMQEQLLEQVVCGDLDEFDPAVQQEAAASPEFAAELAELLELTRQLDSMAAGDSELPPAGPELEGLVGQTLRPLIEDLPQELPADAPGPGDAGEGGQVIRRWPFTTLITAAAALVLGVLGARFFGGDDPVTPIGPGPTLGSGPGIIEAVRDDSGQLIGVSWAYDPDADPGFEDFEVILSSSDPLLQLNEFVTDPTWNFSESLLLQIEPLSEVTIEVKPDDPGFAGSVKPLVQSFSVR